MAWECRQCGYYVDWSQAPAECPECGASQETLFWVNDNAEEVPEYADEEEELAAALAPTLDDEDDEDEDEEEHIPELGEEFGGAFDQPRDSAYFRDEDE